jgi:hypothetical protein
MSNHGLVLAKSLVSKWELEQRRMNDYMMEKLEEQYPNLNTENVNPNAQGDSPGKVRRRRQERLTEINKIIRNKTYSPDNSILTSIRELDQ